MTRVRSVVTTLAEADSATTAEGALEGSLTDLIAKAAIEVEQHVSATRILRTRGLAQRNKASESLKAAAGGAGPPKPRTLDIKR